MVIVRARWILPIADRPLLNGWLALERGRIAATGRAGAALPFKDDAPLIDLGNYALLPALVNTHTHLELSWLRGRIPPRDSFTTWIRELMTVRRTALPDDDVILRAIGPAIDELRSSGTGVVGDVSNTLVTVEPLRRSVLDGVVFHEVVKFQADAADATLEAGLIAVERQGAAERFPVSLVPHAPYSVSPQLFQGIRAARRRTPFLPASVHVAESPEEVELLATGGGPWRTTLESIGAWDPAWRAPGCSPIEYLDRMRVLDSSWLAVHGVQCTDDDLARLAQRGCTLVACPRSNAWVGVGDPPLDRFYRSGVPVAFGTDSLASNADLNLFAELAAARRLAPAISAATLLSSATVVGARALGFEATAGTLEPGRRADVLAIELPTDVVDVEEYLLSGIVPGQVRWVEDLIATSGLRIAD
jgi:cytosine/adenosine deaminase-related metal-dependent hydrolase